MSFSRWERDGVVEYSGRDYLSGQGWWILVALVGGCGAFVVLDQAGWQITVGVLAFAVALALGGQWTSRFRLRLEPPGPVLSYSLLGVPFRRRQLPPAVRARVMGLGGWGDPGVDGHNVVTELHLDAASLDELYLGGREGAQQLSEAIQADLTARYAGAAGGIERLRANMPWLLRCVGWAQLRLGVLRPSLERSGDGVRLDLPTDGLDADPREATLWVVVAALAGAGLAVTMALSMALATWVSGAVLALAVGILAWRLGRSLRVEWGLEAGWVTLTRRRFGVATWALRVPARGWSPRHSWWSGHPTAMAPRLEFDDAARTAEAEERLKFGPAHCASAWAWLPDPEALFGAQPHRPPPGGGQAGGEGRGWRERKRRRVRRR